MPKTAGTVPEPQIVGNRFTLEIKAKDILGVFTSVSGLSIEIETITPDQTDRFGKPVYRKLAGRGKYGDLTLKRVFTGDKALWTWMKGTFEGTDASFRADGSITLYDIAWKELSRWNFVNAWPTKWSVSDLDAGSDDVVMEEVTLCIELLERVS